jgi:hypothetical protein
MEVKIIGNDVAYVGQGMAFPRVVEMRTTREDQMPVELTFTVEYVEESRRYVLKKVEIGSVDSSEGINGQLIRSIQFQDVLLKGLSRLRYFDLRTHEVSQVPALRFRPLNREEIVKQGPTAKTLETVALLYRIAEVLNANQGKHIELALGIPYATAANWISRARKQGAFESISDLSQVFPSLKEDSLRFQADSFV